MAEPVLDWLIAQGKITEEEALTALVCEQAAPDDE